MNTKSDLNKTSNKVILIVILAVFASSNSVYCRESPFTKKGSGPKYWMAYEYCITNNVAIPEAVWKANIDWVADNLKPYGYDMVCNDGWVEGAQTINADGYITKYNDQWNMTFKEWADYVKSKGMKFGVYYNPLWLTKTAYNVNPYIKGTDIRVKSIQSPYHQMNDHLRWIDVNRRGAKEWIQGYVNYFKELGCEYLRIDFVSGYENNFGTERYQKALQWIAEAAGDDIFVSLVMSNSYNNAVSELPYADMIRVADDIYEGDWDFISNRRRGKYQRAWPSYGNLFDGFINYARLGGVGKMILDGDFMRMNMLANDHERRTGISLLAMTGAPMAVADQYYTIGNHLWVYQNEEINELGELGLVAKPIVADMFDTQNSSRFIGQLRNGDWVVGLFNRENVTLTRSIDFITELGLSSNSVIQVRDLWEKKNLGVMDNFSVELPPHACKILRIKHDSKRFQAECASFTGKVVN
ncbi:MAG: hypothetical protein WCZ43_00860 [Proteiniphilum sp.]